MVLKCLYLPRIGRPDILKVSEKTCTIDHEMDQSLWETIISFDLLHSSYMWIQTIWSCGKHCKTIQAGTVSRRRFCGRSRRFKIYIRWNILHLCKSYTCCNKLDVQETNFSFAQFNRIRNHFLGCRIEGGRYTRTWFMGSDRRSSWKDVRTNVKFVQHLTQFKNESNLTEWLMICIMLILFPQTSILLTRKLCCMCLKRTKQ